MAKKPFFIRITIADLLDFATDPDGEGMTVLRFAKELQKGESEIGFIQSLIDETSEFRRKKAEAGSRGGKRKAENFHAVHGDNDVPPEDTSAIPVLGDDIAEVSKVYPVTVSEAVTEPIAVTVKNKVKTLCAIDIARRTEMFNEFWDAFNYKRGKGGAEQSWKKIKLTEPLFQTILTGAKREAKNRPALIAKGSTPKMAQGWLTEKRWEDEHEEAGPKSHRESTNLSAMEEFVNG